MMKNPRGDYDISFDSGGFLGGVKLRKEERKVIGVRRDVHRPRRITAKLRRTNSYVEPETRTVRGPSSEVTFLIIIPTATPLCAQPSSCILVTCAESGCPIQGGGEITVTRG